MRQARRLATCALAIAATFVSSCGVFLKGPPQNSPSSTVTVTVTESPSQPPPMADYKPEYCGVKPGQKGGVSKVLLTIDDFPVDADPGKKMTQIADWAKKHGIVMEAFPIKERLDAYAKKTKTDVVAELRTRGTYVSNHTYTHADLSKASLPQAMTEIQKGVESTYLRPPYGAYTPVIRQWAESKRYRLCTWTVDTNDWLKENNAYPPASELVKRIEQQLKNITSGVPVVILGHYHTHYPEALDAILALFTNETKYELCGNPGPVTAEVPFPVC